MWVSPPPPPPAYDVQPTEAHSNVVCGIYPADASMPEGPGINGRSALTHHVRFTCRPCVNKMAVSVAGVQAASYSRENAREVADIPPTLQIIRSQFLFSVLNTGVLNSQAVNVVHPWRLPRPCLLPSVCTTVTMSIPCVTSCMSLLTPLSRGLGAIHPALPFPAAFDPQHLLAPEATCTPSE